MQSSVTTSSTVPVMDEILAPITVGRRHATPQETRAINALNAVLDDQPGPPKTLFDYSGVSADLRRPRPAVNRVRVKASVARANELAAENLQPAPMVEVRIFGDNLRAEDYTPAFVAPVYEKLVQPKPQTVEPEEAETEVATTRDEAIAAAREVQNRVTAGADQGAVDAAAAEVMTADMMPFGKATLRLFCC